MLPRAGGKMIPVVSGRWHAVRPSRAVLSTSPPRPRVTLPRIGSTPTVATDEKLLKFLVDSNGGRARFPSVDAATPGRVDGNSCPVEGAIMVDFSVVFCCGRGYESRRFASENEARGFARQIAEQDIPSTVERGGVRLGLVGPRRQFLDGKWVLGRGGLDVPDVRGR